MLDNIYVLLYVSRLFFKKSTNNKKRRLYYFRTLSLSKNLIIITKCKIKSTRDLYITSRGKKNLRSLIDHIIVKLCCTEFIFYLFLLYNFYGFLCSSEC